MSSESEVQMVFLEIHITTKTHFQKVRKLKYLDSIAVKSIKIVVPVPVALLEYLQTWIIGPKMV